MHSDEYFERENCRGEAVVRMSGPRGITHMKDQIMAANQRDLMSNNGPNLANGSGAVEEAIYASKSLHTTAITATQYHLAPPQSGALSMIMHSTEDTPRTLPPSGAEATILVADGIPPPTSRWRKIISANLRTSNNSLNSSSHHGKLRRKKGRKQKVTSKLEA